VIDRAGSGYCITHYCSPQYRMEYVGGPLLREDHMTRYIEVKCVIPLRAMVLQYIFSVSLRKTVTVFLNGNSIQSSTNISFINTINKATCIV